MKNLFKLGIIAAFSESVIGLKLMADMQFANAYNDNKDYLLAISLKHIKNSDCSVCKCNNDCNIKSLVGNTYKQPNAYGIKGYSKHIFNISNIINDYLNSINIADEKDICNITEEQEIELDHLIKTSILLTNVGINT